MGCKGVGSELLILFCIYVYVMYVIDHLSVMAPLKHNMLIFVCLHSPAEPQGDPSIGGLQAASPSCSTNSRKTSRKYGSANHKKSTHLRNYTILCIYNTPFPPKQKHLQKSQAQISVS